MPYIHPSPNRTSDLKIVEWADLVTLDLSKFEQPGGKQALAKQLFDALQNVGFFYIVNFGLTQEEVDRQFAIGKEVFQLSTEEKLKYRADLENGGYNGYKPLGMRVSSPQPLASTSSGNNLKSDANAGDQAWHLRQY